MWRGYNGGVNGSRPSRGGTTVGSPVQTLSIPLKGIMSFTNEMLVQMVWINIQKNPRRRMGIQNITSMRSSTAR